MIKYQMNLVKSVRAAEKRDQKHRQNIIILFAFCFGLLGLSGYNVFLKLMSMENVIISERNKLKAIEAEYRNYQETQSTIDKEDIELLNSIQMSRIYWTKKLEAMASHLPEEDPISYWITKFGYKDAGKLFTVTGFGYITAEQEQLLTLDEYLNKLRADRNYSDVFGNTALKSTVRSDEADERTRVMRERVSFEYTSKRRGQ